MRILGREERAVHRGRVVIMGQQLAVTLMHMLKDRLVVPKGIVGIKAEDQFARAHVSSSGIHIIRRKDFVGLWPRK